MNNSLNILDSKFLNWLLCCLYSLLLQVFHFLGIPSGILIGIRTQYCQATTPFYAFFDPCPLTEALSLLQQRRGREFVFYKSCNPGQVPPAPSDYSSPDFMNQTWLALGSVSQGYTQWKSLLSRQKTQRNTTQGEGSLWPACTIFLHATALKEFRVEAIKCNSICSKKQAPCFFLSLSLSPPLHCVCVHNIWTC